MVLAYLWFLTRRNFWNERDINPAMKGLVEFAQALRNRKGIGAKTLVVKTFMQLWLWQSSFRQELLQQRYDRSM